MIMDDMKDTRTKLVEAADKLSAYVEGMDKLTEYVGKLWKEIEEANNTLSSAAKENQLKNTADALEKMNDELKALKSSLANFSDRGSLVRQRIEKAIMMTAEIRDIDARVARLCKSFNRLNKSNISELMTSVGRFEVTSNEIKDGLKYYRNNVQYQGDYLNRIKNKLSVIEALQARDDALDRKIEDKLGSMELEVFLQLQKSIREKSDCVIATDKALTSTGSSKSIVPYEEKTKIENQRVIKDILNNLSVGDEIIFGKYNRYDIVWRVLEKTKTGLLLLSKYGLVKKEFNKWGCGNYWSDATLRSYLNNRFINKHFNELEAEMIVNARLGGRHWKWDKVMSDELNDDKVFLFSKRELSKYFKDIDERICYGLNGGIINASPCSWWLRDISPNTQTAFNIDDKGRLINSCNSRTEDGIYVRPVMWIEVSGKCNIYKVGEKSDERLPDLDVYKETIEKKINEPLERDLSYFPVTTKPKSTDVSILEVNENRSIDKKGKINAVTKKAINRSNWYYNVKVQKPDAKLKKGNVVVFGRWQGEKIIWRVLCRKKGQLCLISLFGLEPRAFHTGKDIVTWKDSSLRQYLNTAFMEKCFCHQEIEKIVDKNVRYLDIIAEGNSKFSWSIDNIYLPSRKEVEDLEEDPVNLRCMAIDGTNEECDWWLRTPGRNAAYAVCVGRDGNIISKGYKVDSKKRKVYIRPIMWINVEKI